MRKGIFISLIVFAAFVAKIYYDTNSLVVRYHTIENPRLGEVLKGIKIAHISDLHIKSIGPREKKIVDILKEEKPDFIFFTGDFIGFKGSFHPAISLIREMKAGSGIYGVLGNIDYSNENGSCILCHKEKSKELIGDHNKLKILRNSAVELNINGKVINIIGLDDPVQAKSDIRAALSKTNPDAPSILLAHSPSVLKQASNSGMDLLLCGHNHGGQIFLIKYIKRFLRGGSSLKYLDGFYQEINTLMHVSRGAGTSFFPFRLGVKPEISFLQFVSNRDLDIDTKENSSPSYVYFDGVSLSRIIDLFNFHPISAAALYLKERTVNWGISQHLSVGAGQAVENREAKASRKQSKQLADFETEAEMQDLNWECHKWFERSPEYSTSGEFSLRAVLPPGKYPGIAFHHLAKNWANHDYFKLDVFNPADYAVPLHVRVDDDESGLDYGNRFDRDYFLRPGKNTISIYLREMETNISKRNLDLKGIKKVIIFIRQNDRKRELFLDNLRLEN